jgi:hypothetical protein
MGRMYFIPGMSPRHVSGAAGASGPRRVQRLVSGPAYRGAATPTNIVPYEEPRVDASRPKRIREERARDVADALHFVRDAPNSAREKLNATRRAAAEAALD